MKARLYHDTRKKSRDCVDAWSIYFPYPKRMREQKQTYGTFIGCTPTEDGMNVVRGILMSLECILISERG